MTRLSSFALAIALLVLSASYSLAVPIKPGAPDRAYGLNEGTGTLVSPTGAGPTGTVTGGAISWVPGHTGLPGDNAVRQLGGAYIPFADPTVYDIGGAQSYTVSVWIRHNSTFSGNEMIWGTDNSGVFGYMLKRDTGGQLTYNHGGTTWTGWAAGGNAGIGNNVWHNYVVRYDASQLPGLRDSLWIDGVNTDTWQLPFVADYSAKDVNRMVLMYTFGPSSPNPWGRYDASEDARLDDFAFWRSALSNDNIEWLGISGNSMTFELVPEPSAYALGPVV